MTDYITIDTDSESGGIDLDDWTTRLEESLDSIHGFGRVAVFQHYDSFVNPGLEISGTQLIPLPLAGRDALTIKSACREAPFGRGDETVVDTSVRKTWELDHTHFKLTNPRWPVFLTSLVLKASSDLGLVGVDAHPHKLLLYEEDSFFRPHKDTEKEHGMVGTLVICLPSQHTGGDVHVSFRGKKHILSTASTSAFDMSALAWYSDVTHEVKPLTSGYRLAITYNLVQSGSTLAPGRFMMNQQHRLSLAISNWPESMRRVFYPLEHKYTKSSISLKNLKGRDLAVCQSLLDVAPTSDVFLFLANMTRLQYDDEDDYYSYGGENEARAEVYTCDGTLILGSMDFDKEDGDVLGREAFWTRAADEVEEGEFTGNESAPEGHRYHDSASFTPPALARFPLSTSDMWASAEPFFQAIMLIPRRNLTDFLSHFHVHVEHLVTEVLNDLRRRPPGPDARQNTINFLAQTVICGQDSRRLLIAPLIASAAVEIGAPALYQTAIKEAISASKGDVRGSTNFSTGLHGSGIRTRQRNPFGISEEMLSTLSLLIRESVLKNPKNPIKWEDWLGDLARLLPSLSAFDRVVTFLYRSMDGDLKQSLDDWRRGTFENWLEWRASLGWDDMEVIAKMMVSRPLSPQQQDMDWVMNR
ncbi:uncharacterized protein DNG_10448 [Cephalotrichum gorgonifer]|uniref:Prolyl 4-hydroxylase alpha subunit Fe(2+) 2OG dioxygenase domain-containing protein n=1 Tax=Cephalotrichum gorgonifer TaxID=2041049 RepID=A0AAE8T0B4_9PEZI|nr:uncharacterized protein DNG_10448 [Cephalotrichum gorgonifer]